MKNILIFGTGSVANYLLKHIDFSKVKILAFINSYNNISEFNGYRVINLSEIQGYKYDFIIIATGFYEKAKNELKGIGVNEKNISGFIFDEESTYSCINQKLNAFLDDLLNRKLTLEILNSKENEVEEVPLNRDFYAQSMFTLSPSTHLKITKDYVREKTLQLISEEIKRKNIKGSIAELGVFKGDFSYKLNSLFPKKKLYLFDTFEGFNELDLQSDNSVDFKAEKLKFKDTNTSSIIANMEYPENCILKKGYFPDTFDLYKETFCFVSIDVDLYKPILNGLEIFYPRLNQGGYIFVHDYNNMLYEGTRRAVIEYCDKNEISYVPIPDFFGSIVICK